MADLVWNMSIEDTDPTGAAEVRALQRSVLGRIPPRLKEAGLSYGVCSAPFLEVVPPKEPVLCVKSSLMIFHPEHS